MLEHLLTEITLLPTPMEVTTGSLKATLEGHTDNVRSVAFSPDGQMLASGSRDKIVRLWNPHTGKLLYTLIEHTAEIMSVAFSPDDSTLASASWDGMICLWNPHTGEHKRTLTGGDGLTSVVFSPAGQMLVSSSRTIRLWNTVTWGEHRKLLEHTEDLVESLAFSPDGGTLASGSRDKTVRLWDIHTGQLLHTLTEHTNTVNRLAFSPDGQTLASAALGFDNTIRLWNPNTGKLKRTLPNQGGWQNPVAFSPDGATLVIGNRGISLWDTETGQYKKPLIEDIGETISVAFSPDGQILASGSADNKVRLWDFTPFLITPGLSKVSGDNQTGVSGTVLTNPLVVEVRDENLSVRKGISVTFTITAGDGTLSVTRTMTDANGRAESTLTLGPNQGMNTVSVSAAGIGGAVTFNAVAEPAIDIPDANLRAAIEDALDKAPGTPIAPAEIVTMTRLEARNANISDLTGIEFATNLTDLDLSDNNITDISPVAGLTYLNYLHLNDNNITDISPVTGLTNLSTLVLSDNNITDTSPVAGLTNLRQLFVYNNNITDLPPVAGLTNLKDLWLYNNNITDISGLSGLTNLSILVLSDNNITDISVVTGLTYLDYLHLNDNNITDISPLVANMGLGAGDTVHVRGNPLSYQSINNIPTLEARGVTVEFDNSNVINMNGMVQGDVPFANEPFDVNNIPEPVPLPKEVRDFFGLSDFWQQWINIEGFPILASAKVSPYATKELAWQIRHTFRGRIDLLQKMVKIRRQTFTLIAHNEVVGDIPELSDQPLLFYWNVRARGGMNRLLGSSVEQVLGNGYVPMHELAHAVQDLMYQQIDPTFDNRLQTAYNAAMDKGLWQGSYLAINKDEYFTNGVNVWFHSLSTIPVKTRDGLKAYDPDLAVLIAEIFGENDWRYTPIESRLHLPHLQGFDPESAPWVEFPPGVEEAYEELRDPAIEERSEWVNLPPYDPSLLPRLNELRNRDREAGLLVGKTYILVASIIDAEVLFYWVYPDGTERFVHRLPPKPWQIDLFRGGVGDLLLAKDNTGRPLAVFQAVEKTGRVLITPTFNLITLGLSKVSGDNQAAVSGALLANPFVVEVRDDNLSVLEGIVVTFTVTAGDGTLSVTRTTTNKNGRAESTLTLGPNQGMNTVSVSADSIEGTETFNAVAAVAADILDVDLRAAINDALGKAPGTLIFPSELAALTHLEAPNANISDLTGLKFATNLTELYFGAEWVEGEGWVNSNSASDLPPLVGLTNLKRLDLRGNNITDVSPLAGLTNLIWLELWSNRISDLSPLAGLTNLTELRLGGNSISNLSPLAGLTNLAALFLQSNRISDLSPLAGLTNLKRLGAASNNISDLSPLAGLTNLTTLGLRRNRISDISPLAGLTNLAKVVLISNSISDLSPLVTNAGLGRRDTVKVQGNPLSYLSIHRHIPDLQNRGVTVEFDNRIPAIPLKISGDNQEGAPGTILDQSFAVDVQDQNGKAFAGVPVVFTVTEGGGTLSITSTVTDANGRAESTLTLGSNPGTNTVTVSVEGIPQPAIFSAEAVLPPSVPTTLSIVSGDNQSGLTGEALANPFVVEVRDQYDDPMEGITVTFAVSAGRGTPSPKMTTTDANGQAESTLTLGSNPGTNTVEVSVERITEMLTFNALAKLLEFDLSMPTDISLIHVPLKVVTVDGVEKPIESVGDLYDALGGADTVNFLVTLDSQAQKWHSYVGTSSTGTPADKELTVGMGIIASMKAPASIRLTGNPLGTDGSSAVTLNQGLNLVGLPLRDERINRVSDLLRLDGILGNVPVITLNDGGKLKTVGRAGDPGDIEITGGQAFILNARQTVTVSVSGDGWTNVSVTAAAPPMLRGIQVGNTTPVLALSGSIVDEETGKRIDSFRVTVKNLSTGKAATAVTGSDKTDYRHIIVDIETERAAMVGDILEISTQSPDPFIGVQPLWYKVTAEDVKRNRIELPSLVAYEIPVETELLANYPNPFNPETWIPYRLAEDGFVILTIYDTVGQVVRTLDVGHRIAAAYENRSKAIYWAGRNDVGEPVASGVYFYHLSAGDFSATRRMVILK